MTNKKGRFLDLKRDFGIISKYATTETKVSPQGGWLVCSNLVITSTADRTQLEIAGWRKRESAKDEWFLDYTASQEKQVAREFYEGYKKVFESFVDKAKKKIQERKAALSVPLVVVEEVVVEVVVEELTEAEVDAVGLMVGSAPCQPFSLAQSQVETKVVAADNKENKEKSNMGTIEIPVVGLAKVVAVLAVVAALVFGGYGLFTGKLSSEKQVVDVIHTEAMSIMKVEEQNGEWLVFVGSPEKANRMFIRKSDVYDTTWYDETGRRIDGNDLEALFQADKVRKQADEVLHTDSTVNAD